MSWFPVDDAAHSHPKMRHAGLEAVGLWVVSGSFCMAYLTDGFVPEWFVKEKPRGITLAKRLVEAGLWRAGENGKETGWWFHDWKPECTKAEIQKAREKARLRKQKSRELHADAVRPVTRDETRDDTVSSRGCLGPTQPNPTQPINPLVTSSGRVTESNARDAPPTCRRHPNGTDNPCGTCAARRQWERQAAEAAKADELKAKRQARKRAENCPHCHGTNVIEIGDNAVRKCDHVYEAAHA
jgi:hypothetical protein